jgi:phage tail protein X
LLLGYSKGESEISPGMVKSCFQDLRLGGSEAKAHGVKKGAGPEAGPKPAYFKPWWKWAAAVLLVAVILAFLAVRYGDRILSGFVSASVRPPKPKAEALTSKPLVIQAEPQKPAASAPAPSAPERQPAVVEPPGPKAAAPTPVPSVQEKQPPAVIEQVKVEAKEEKKELPSGPAVERSVPPAVRAGPPEVRAEPDGQTIVVERGDTLGKLSMKVYGRSNERVLEMIQKNNPTIRDPDLILPGQKLHFPPIPEGTQ